ncbi:MAG: N-acetylmuramoyl-L-alanine amidase [bacterium]|nr:N-acetylmuramoyl-L-alanine amidase [bacterium]
MKRTFVNPAQFSVCVALCGLLFSCGTPKQSPELLTHEPVQLDVVYPRLEGNETAVRLPHVDSTFAFGSVRPPGSKVFVNGVAAKVYDNGAFLAFFPLDTLSQRYLFWAISPRGDTLRQTLPFIRQEYQPQPGATGKEKIADPLNKKLPARITISENHAHISSIPDQAYSILPAKGAVALVDSFVPPFYRVYLKQNLHGWIEAKSVTVDFEDHQLPWTTIGALSVLAESLWTNINIPLKEPILFNIQQSSDENGLIIDLFQASSRISQIKYDPADELIQDIRWEQIEDDLLRLEVSLDRTPFWGYHAEYRDGGLVVKIRKPPNISRNVFKNRIIALDAGHGGKQPGAIGPTRLLEKDVNFDITRKLQRLLTAKGARVIMTRDSDATVDLYERVDYAVQQGAEILISVHNNALSDGENPFLRHGSSIYYYHSQSRRLAEKLHQSLVKATQLRDYGLFYKNLALARPTEMPAALVECAYIMYPEEEALLRDDHFQELISRGMLDGLGDFLKMNRQRQKNYFPTHSEKNKTK